MKFHTLVIAAVAVAAAVLLGLSAELRAEDAPAAKPSGAGTWKTIWIKRGYVGDYDAAWAGGPGKIYRKPVPLPVTGTAVRVWARSQHATPVSLAGASLIKAAEPHPSLKDGKVQGTALPITFAGKPDLEIAPKSAEASSDEVPVTITPGLWYLQEQYSSPKSGYAYDADGFFSVPAETPEAAASERTVKGSIAGNIFRIDVLTTDPEPVVLCYGDSITQGAGSTAQSGKRYPEILSGLLAQPVLNMGQNGDLVLFSRGVPGVVKSLCGVTRVVLLMGINDIISGHEKMASAEDYAKVVGSVAKALHRDGIQFYLGTITPSGGYAKFDADPAKEALRQAINAWIRAQTSVDGVDGIIDYDEALRDPDKPVQMRAEYSSGDWLHPGDKGYEKMAETAAKVLKGK